MLTVESLLSQRLFNFGERLDSAHCDCCRPSGASWSVCLRCCIAIDAALVNPTLACLYLACLLYLQMLL